MRGIIVRLKALFEAYGPLALGIWWVIFGVTLAGFFVAIRLGLEVGAEQDPEATASFWGTLVAAYLAAALTKPVRALATVSATPLVARWLGVRPAAPEPVAEEAERE